MIDHDPLPGAVYIALGRIGEPAMGWAWRIWASRTSFYLKCSAPGIKHLKLSLHSDDPRHPAGGGFKIRMDTQEAFERPRSTPARVPSLIPNSRATRAIG